MYKYNALITRIIDGDTVEVSIDLGLRIWTHKIPLRLYGINAPEGKRTLAADHLTTHILGKQVSLETYKPDKYGRWLATIWMGDRSINNELIANGLAVPYMGAGN